MGDKDEPFNMKQACQDLYDQLSPLKGFNDYRKWTPKDSLYDVFSYLCDRGKLMTKEPTMCMIQQRKGRYRLAQLHTFENWDNFIKCPLSWLPSIAHKWPDLHDFAVDVIRGLLVINGVPWYEECMPGGIINEYLRDSSNEGADEAGRDREALEFYNKSYPYIYFKKFKDKAPLKLTMDRIPVEPGALQLYGWLIKAVPLIRSKDSFFNYRYTSNLDQKYYNGNCEPLCMEHAWGFAWSCDSSKDLMYSEYTQWIDNTWNEGGAMPPFLPVPIGQPVPDPKTTFIGQLQKWLHDGFHLTHRLEKAKLIADITHERTGSLELVPAH